MSEVQMTDWESKVPADEPSRIGLNFEVAYRILWNLETDIIFYLFIYLFESKL